MAQITASIEDVAKRAGVSRHTVARALNDQTKQVWPSTARRVERIRRIAAEMGYRPNAAARATRSGRFGHIALVNSNRAWRSSLPGPLLQAITQALDSEQLHLTVARLNDAKLTDPTYMPNFLRTWMCDALLLNYHVAAPKVMADLIDTHHLPAIWLNTRHDYDAIYLADYEAGRDATARLLAMGHRRIALVDTAWNRAHRGDSLHYSRLDRHQGYVDAMHEAGLSPRRIDDAPGVTLKNTVAHLVRELSGDDRPTAILVNGPSEAVIRALWLGRIDVPRQMSVVGFDLDPMVLDEARLAMIVAPHERMGAVAVQMLHEKMQTGRTLESRVVELEWKDGFSLGPPPA
jgi:LacI family transcriptional regulator